MTCILPCKSLHATSTQYLVQYTVVQPSIATPNSPTDRHGSFLKAGYFPGPKTTLAKCRPNTIPGADNFALVVIIRSGFNSLAIAEFRNWSPRTRVYSVRPSTWYSPEPMKYFTYTSPVQHKKYMTTVLTRKSMDEEAHIIDVVFGCEPWWFFFRVA